MTHKEKAIELLSQMPEPYRTMAFENLEKHQNKLKEKPNTIWQAIDYSFSWHKTIEKELFWWKVFKHYKYGTPLPEVPLEYQCKQFVNENEELKRKVAELESKMCNAIN